MQSLTDGPIVWKRLGARDVEGVQDRDAARSRLRRGGRRRGVRLARPDWSSASTIFVAITLSMIVACLLGVAVPAMLRAAKADPKIAAGPVVLAAADVATLLLYFGLGTRFLGSS